MLNIAKDMAERQGLNPDLYYEAQVIDNNDPTHNCRVRARVPVLFNGIPDAHLPWATAFFDHEDGAGPGSGTAYVPRIGTKVLIKFQMGQESSPIWSGYPVDDTTQLQEMLHNYPDRKVHRLANKALVVVDTRSNEVFIRNPGDTRVYIEGNLELTVNGNVTEKINGNRSSFVQGDSLEVVSGNRVVNVGGASTESVAGAVSAVGGSTRHVSTTGAATTVVGGSSSLSVSGEDSYNVGGTHTRNASIIQDNSAGPTTTGPDAVATAPEAPDLSQWIGIDGGAEGAFLKGFSPQASALDVATSLGEDMDGPANAATQDAYKRAGTPLNATGTGSATANKASPTASSTGAPTPAKALPASCAAFADKTSFASTMKLSDNFTLGDVSTSAVLERSAVRAQSGLALAQIVCNLKGLAVNMLDPIMDKFGRPSINCGFRPATASYGSPTGWHLKGCAADIQWPGISDAEYYARAVWIKDNLPFCEIILEYGGQRPWIHVAFHAESLSTSNFKTRTGVPSTYSRGILALGNRPGVGGA